MGTRLFSWSVFPLVLGGSLAWAMLQMQAGAPPFQAFALPLVAANLLVAACERLLPLHGSWLHSRGDVHVDAGLALCVALLSAVLGRSIAPLGAAAATSYATVLGGGLWPSGWPLLAQLVLALVVAELPKYGLHRLEHEWAPLWRIHATHHSAQRLYWLNAGRFHPIDIGLDYLLGVGTLLLLGCGDAVIALFILVSGVHGVFQHANLPLRLGPLNWFFSMAELHRWHHMPDAARSNHNYGQNLIVWDVVFGTRYLPAREQPGDAVGIEGWPGFPTGFFANLLVPFRWARVQSEARSTPA